MPSSAEVSLVDAGSRSARSRAAPSALPSRRNSCADPRELTRQHALLQCQHIR